MLNKLLLGFVLGEPETLHLMVFGPSGHDHDSQNQLHLIFGSLEYFKQFKENPESLLEKIIFGNLKNWEVDFFETCVKDRAYES